LTGGYHAQVPALAASRQCTLLKRYQIKILLQTGISQAEIADVLNCFKNTILREIRCNSFEGKDDIFNAQVTVTVSQKFAEKTAKKALKYCRLYERGSSVDDYLNQAELLLKRIS